MSYDIKKASPGWTVALNGVGRGFGSTPSQAIASARAAIDRFNSQGSSYPPLTGDIASRLEAEAQAFLAQQTAAEEAKKKAAEEAKIAEEQKKKEEEAAKASEAAAAKKPENNQTVGDSAPANEAQTANEVVDPQGFDETTLNNGDTTQTDTGAIDFSNANRSEQSDTGAVDPSTLQTLDQLDPTVFPDVVVSENRSSVEAKSPAIPQVTTENPLHPYDSYTYSLSFYILSMDEYQTASNAPETWTPKNENLLVASAGRYGSNRNPNFQTDFYFEDLEFTTVLAASPQNRNSNLIEGSFKIIEPLGFTFINRIIEAANGVIVPGKSPRYEQQPYLIKIEFYGIKDGEIKPSPIQINEGGQKINTTKYIPILITSMDAEITERGGEYKINFVPYSHQVLLNKNLIIQTDFEIEGTTVEDFLGSPNVNNPKNLSSQINRYYKQLKDKTEATESQEVYFEIDPLIAKSRVILKKSSTQNQSSTLKTNAASFKFTNGQRIDRAIDYIIRNSEWFTNQVTTSKKRTTSDEPLVNFKILPKIEHLGYNKNLNSYIYKTTYFIKPYQVTSNHSEGVRPKPEGQVKEYNYIFTGKNIDILDFKLNFNLLYIQTISAFKNARSVIEGQAGASEAENKALQTKIADEDKSEGVLPAIESKTAAPQTVATNKTSLSTIAGSNSAVSDTAAHVIENLLNTSQGDMINISLRIIGDPLFIKQDDLFYSPTIEDDKELLTKNGSFIMDRGELYILLKFITPQDYDESTGLTDLTDKKFGYSDFSGYYKVISIKNSFSTGKFEQTLDLVRVLVDEDTLKKVSEKTKELQNAREEEVQRIIQLPALPTPENLNESVKALTAKFQGAGDLLSIAKAGGDITTAAKGLVTGVVGGIGDAIGAIGNGVTGALGEVGDAIQNSDIAASAKRLANGIGLPEGINPTGTPPSTSEENFGSIPVDSDGNPIQGGTVKEWNNP